MRIRSIGFLALLLATSPVFAADTPPSDASIHELFQVMHTHKLIDGIVGQMDGMLRKSEQQSMAGKTLDAGEQKILDEQTQKLNKLLTSFLSWQNVEPTYMDIYRKSLSQKEVNDTIAFYKTPSGQALVAKMPALMQQSIRVTQEKMAAIMPQIQQIAQEASSQLAAYRSSQAKTPAHASSTGNGG